MYNFLYIYRRKSPAGKKHTYKHIEKEPSTLKQMRTFQSWIEKSTVELKKKKAEKYKHSIGALLEDLQTTISLIIKCQCIHFFTTNFTSPQSILSIYFQIDFKNSIYRD